MIAFSRLATFLFFVLSLSYFTCAAPTSGQTHELAVRGGDCGTVMNVLMALEAKLKGHYDVCDHADVLSNVQVDIIAKVVADIDTATKACVEVGAIAIADVPVKVKADICTRIAAIVTIVARIIIKLSAKLSISVMVTICAQLDVCLKALLVALNVCISGVVGLSLKAISDLTIVICIKIKLELCAGLLGLH
ncbi:unnamed protein product [Rhizoctonia solani]|uniref:Transmembrane protein n=1 Tax=Rhizoctonia solani TaxID=456999 RepID=A0A8H3BCM4_9AGAM|nr:unnamed protein product [Rhizoctonia solani]